MGESDVSSTSNARRHALVDVQVDRSVAVLTLNDPRRRNCVSPALSKQVAAACAELRADRSVSAVILTGAGPAFSAGGDVEALTARSEPLSVSYLGFQGLAALRVPVVAAVNGPAIGAGMNFALACDVIVAARSARFESRFLDIGIHPGGGHVWRMRQLVGRQAAAATVLFGEALTAEQAHRIGLVWDVVDDDELLPRARRMADRAAQRSNELVRRAKTTLGMVTDLTRDELAVEVEGMAQEWSMSRPAFAEGVAALRARLHQTAPRGSSGG